MSGSVPPGSHFIYDFVASPAGVYHCHVSRIQSHISHGLYGALIIDPKIPREPAKEMVMLTNGYNLKDDYSKESEMTAPPTAAELRANFTKATGPDEGGNQIYTVNGPAFIYRDHPI